MPVSWRECLGDASRLAASDDDDDDGEEEEETEKKRKHPRIVRALQPGGVSDDRGLEDVLRGGLVVEGQLPAAEEGRARGSGAREAQGGRGHPDPGSYSSLACPRSVHQTDTVSARQRI